VPGLDDGQHALLALAGEHLERFHARLALGHLGDVDVHADAAAAGGLAGGAGQPGAPQVLDADDQFPVGGLVDGRCALLEYLDGRKQFLGRLVDDLPLAIQLEPLRSALAQART
jgi:hypothetical protein